MSHIILSMSHQEMFLRSWKIENWGVIQVPHGTLSDHEAQECKMCTAFRQKLIVWDRFQSADNVT